MTAVKIEKKITSYRVKTEDPVKPPSSEPVKEVLHEGLGRPDMLLGATYKIKTPASDHAIYVTINDILLNIGTDHESRHPYEMFINSKNMDQFQWVLALTRTVSAVFRKGGDVAFLVEELKNVFDPKGGYFKKSTFMPSLVAEIGHVLERHMKMIGLIPVERDERQLAYLEQKRAEVAEKTEETGYPEEAVLCSKCNVKAVIRMDGCLTCLNCGDSKCG